MIMNNKIKYNWFQTEELIVIDLLLKNMNSDNVNIIINPDQSLIDVLNSSWKIYPTKIEIKLKKSEESHWSKLEKENISDITSITHNYPSSTTRGPKNWDKIEKEIEKEEQDAKLEGEGAITQLFQQIYADGSDEVKRAMNKSFIESGCTVLSTNWKDVAEQKVKVKPPQGMEWKSYS
ncbi:protein SGT1 homolog isoform X2 [Gordionus sp. m RMFG-2023]|uniref:protein SGT1 homolog isoform X2 n=1 Tax=Gordionus sp. m RMFG-2023 TaxID=3053472 RepID=UPI0031FBAE05